MKNAKILGLSSFVSDAIGLNNNQLNTAIGGNTGNLLFVHSIRELTNASPFAASWGVAHQSTEDVCFVVPLANQLNKGFDLGSLAKDFSKVQQPIAGIGLGAQSGSITDDPASLARQLPAGTRDWLQVMKERAPTSFPSICMRGEFSLKVAKSLYDCDAYVVTGCPSNFINPNKSLGMLIRERLQKPVNRVAVAAGAPHFNFPKLEACLSRIVQETDGIYICQHPIDLLALGNINLQASKPYALKVAAYLQIGSTFEDVIAWMKRYSVYYLGASDWINSMAKYDLVVGMRIHGVMAGIQSGIPGLCICIDSRTQELCETMHIPWVNAQDYISGISVDQIVSILKSWDWSQFDTTRLKLCKTMNEFFDQNMIKKSPHLAKILA